MGAFELLGANSHAISLRDTSVRSILRDRLIPE